jgi:hypothetical protein
MTQKQESSKGAVAIQSGHDTIIQQGLSPEQMKLVLESLAAQLTSYTAVARQVVDERLAEFEKRVVDRFSTVPASTRQAFADPDFQYAITRAQHAYARSGDSATLEALIGVIDQRAGRSDRSRLSLTLDAAMETVADLTANEFAELSLCFILRYSKNPAVQNLEGFKQYIDLYVAPFMNSISRELSSYQYLESKQCASIGIGAFPLIPMLRKNYAGLFQPGITMDQVRSLLPSDSSSILDNSPILIPCLNDESKLQFNALDRETLLQRLQELHIPGPIASNLGTYFETNALGGPALVEKLGGVISEFNHLSEVWDNTPMKNLTLTSLGIAIGYCNARRAISSWAGDLSIWIK